MPQPSEIRTARLLLRPIDKIRDAEGVLDWYKLESTSRFTSAQPRTTVEEVRDFIDMRSNGPTSLNCAIVLPHDKPDGSDRVIGVMGTKTWPELGYTFHPAFHGKGFATEALEAYVPELWRHMPAAKGRTKWHAGQERPEGEAEPEGFDYALAICDVENVPSIKVCEKVGFVRGHVLKDEYESPQLGMRDSVPLFLPRPGTELPMEWLQTVVEEQKPAPDVL